MKIKSNTIIAFLCGALASFIVCTIIFCNIGVTVTTQMEMPSNNEAPEDFDNPSGFSATKTDHHGMKYTALYFTKIARSVREEELPNTSVEHFYNDNPTIPDWGAYAGSTPEEKEKLEYTTYGDTVHVRNVTNYLYIFDNDSIEKQVFAYMRILYQSGYEFEMGSPECAIFVKDGWYVMISSMDKHLYHQICISISDDGFGI